MTTKNAAPEVVIELTKTYLHKLSDRELQDHFINFSDRFADSLKTGAEDELEMLQAYLRLITTEMSARLKGTTNA